MSVLSWYSLTGTGYERGWWTNYKGRYRAYKGARNTKKSYDMLGLEALHKVISNPMRNILFLRNTFNSHRNSTYATMKMLINTPDPNRPEISLARYFKFNDNEMMDYIVLFYMLVMGLRQMLKICRSLINIY